MHKYQFEISNAINDCKDCSFCQFMSGTFAEPDGKLVSLTRDYYCFLARKVIGDNEILSKPDWCPLVEIIEEHIDEVMD